VVESRGNFFSTNRARRLAPIGNAAVEIVIQVVHGAAADSSGHWSFCRGGATRNNDDTIVCFTGDPIGLKLVNSLARPGGNVTGLTDYDGELGGKRLSLFKEAFPRMTRVALLVKANDQQAIDQYQTAASALGLSLHPVEVHSREEFERAFDRIADEHLEEIMADPYALLAQGRAQLARLTMMRRLPFMGFNRRFAEAGAVMSYGADMSAMFRRGGEYVDKILKGKKPADLPVEQPTKFELVVNLKTAETLGITIPQSILFRADEILWDD
jgi:putative ABC transport system substrate-binding protein